MFSYALETHPQENLPSKNVNLQQVTNTTGCQKEIGEVHRKEDGKRSTALRKTVWSANE